VLKVLREGCRTRSINSDYHLLLNKLVLNNQTGSIGEGKMWNFLKEISTNGDMQTMDVVCKHLLPVVALSRCRVVA
jgi:hypothetical protein